MITSYSKMVNLNYIAIGVVFVLSEHLFCNWRPTLMHTIMPHVINIIVLYFVIDV
jgi:hypothetical protein